MTLRSNKLKIVAAVLLLAAGAVVAWWWLDGLDDSEALTLYGNVDIREVDLGFRVGGRLASMQVDEGDEVVAGETLARLDPQPYEEAVAAAEARVQQATAALRKLETGSRPEEIEQARARVAEARAAFENAEREAQRQQGLVESGASSEKAYEAARARREQTAAALASARAALELAQAGFRDEDVAAGRAELAAAEADLQRARTQLADTELTAPSAGIVTSRVREPGTVLAAGAPVYTLSLRDPTYVRAYVAEPDLGRVAPGTRVVVTTDSSERRYRGQVGFVSPRAEFTPKSVETPDLRTDLVYRLRIVIEDADDGLRQGMPVTVTFDGAGGAG
ncbi:MAG TPA: secretion protein HlyD [Steroidobacteraceae bacterium]|nr:secretion protein HlyD [Steroidobacteraceae bacterium]